MDEYRTAGKKRTGIRYFIMEHMEQYFSKILIISSGKYLKELNSLEGRINITVISGICTYKAEPDLRRGRDPGGSGSKGGISGDMLEKDRRLER